MNNNYSLNDILEVASKLTEEEKDYLFKKSHISDALFLLNNKGKYNMALNAIENHKKELDTMKSSLENLEKALKKSNSDKVFEYANTKIMPEIDAYTFARMVNVVEDITQIKLSSCSTKVYKILERLFKIKEYKLDMNHKDDEDIHTSKNVLGNLFIPFDKKIFWILSEINNRWSNYTNFEKAAIAKAIGTAFCMETFLVLMENWSRVDNQVSGKRVKEILDSCKELTVTKQNEEDDKYHETLLEDMRVLQTILQKVWSEYPEKKQNPLIGFVSAMIDINEKVNNYERSED